MGFNQAPTLPYNKLGIIEDGDTASQSIEKDKYVVWKGNNYFAKTDILQGEAFVVDTNLTEVTEGAINGIVDALHASLTKIELLTTITAWPSAALTLPKSYKEYTFLQIDIANSESPNRCNNIVINTATIDNSKRYNLTVLWGVSYALTASLRFTDETHVSIVEHTNAGGWAIGYLKFYGIM